MLWQNILLVIRYFQLVEITKASSSCLRYNNFRWSVVVQHWSYQYCPKGEGKRQPSSRKWPWAEMQCKVLNQRHPIVVHRAHSTFLPVRLIWIQPMTLVQLHPKWYVWHRPMKPPRISFFLRGIVSPHAVFRQRQQKLLLMLVDRSLPPPWFQKNHRSVEPSSQTIAGVAWKAMDFAWQLQCFW